MEESTGKKNRISTIGILLIGFCAIIFELITLIPFAGTLLGWVYWVGLTFYLWKTGHGLANWKLVAPSIISFAAEFFPAVQELPTIVAATIIIVIVSRIEDKTGVRLMPGTKKPGMTPPRGGRPAPLNSGGLRPPQGGITRK